MGEPGQPVEKKPMTFSDAMWIGVFALVAIMVVACGWGLLTRDDDSASSSGPAVASSDATAKAACDHFRNIAGDARQGILGADQLLPKLREVHQTASASGNAGVRNAATALLRAATQPDGDMEQATLDMSWQCQHIGH